MTRRRDRPRWPASGLIDSSVVAWDMADGHPEIARGSTALRRSKWSRPVALALEHGILDQKRSFLDYGCGHDDDFRGLREFGFDAVGWDLGVAFRDEDERARHLATRTFGRRLAFDVGIHERFRAHEAAQRLDRLAQIELTGLRVTDARSEAGG